VFQLIMLMNFALRSCMAVYATLATEIILNNFDLSFYALGGILSGAGKCEVLCVPCIHKAVLLAYCGFQA
jgi:hypothetical protein